MGLALGGEVMKVQRVEISSFTSGISMFTIWVFLHTGIMQGYMLMSTHYIFLAKWLFLTGAIARLIESAILYLKETNLHKKGSFLIDADSFKFKNKVKKGSILVGKGFLWTSEHAQKIYDLKSEKKYSKIIEKGKEEGNPVFHNVGIHKEENIYLDVASMKGHMLIAGTTRVGKTVALRLLIKQAIMRNEPVLIIDPKGDDEMLDDVYDDAKQAGRENDFLFFSLAHPSKSCSYNPLETFAEATDLSSRIASLMPQDAKSKPFTDYAQTVLTEVANGLLALDIKPTLRLLHEYSLVRMKDLVTILEWSLEIKKDDQKTRKARNELLELANVEEIPIEKNKVIKQKKMLYYTHLKNLADNAGEHFRKMTASLEPIFNTLNAGEVGELLNQPNPDISWENAVYKNKIVYFYLASMFKGEAKSGGVGKLALQDLLQFIGREYAFSKNVATKLNIFVDEFYNVVFPGYVDLLNKAGGTDTRVTLAMQTTDDAISALESQSKAKQIISNTNTRLYLRVPELDVAKTFTELTPTDIINTRMKTYSVSPSTSGGSHFGTNIGERSIPQEINIVTEDFLASLPRGQAFLRYHGKIYKVRIPMIKRKEERFSFAQKVMSADFSAKNINY